MASVKIYDNTGTTVLWEGTIFVYDGYYWLSTDENGRPVVGWSSSNTTPPSTYNNGSLYEDNTHIAGLSSTANQTSPSSSWNFESKTAFPFGRTYGAIDGTEPDQITYVVGAVTPVTYKKLTYSGSPIQVESAIRDGTGQIIKDKCARHATFTIDTDDTTTNVLVSSLRLRSGELPRMVQIFDASGKEVGAEVNISATQITVNLIDAPADETWTAQVTAW